MPTVGKKKFPYTKDGEQLAKNEAKKTGKPLTKKKKQLTSDGWMPARKK